MAREGLSDKFPRVGGRIVVVVWFGKTLEPRSLGRGRSGRCECNTQMPPMPHVFGSMSGDCIWNVIITYAPSRRLC